MLKLVVAPLVVVLAAVGASLPAPPSSLPAPPLPTALRVPGPLSPRIANYHITADFDAVRHFIRAREHVTWRNTQAAPASRLSFHLYMNAFKNESSVFLREAAAGGGRWAQTPEHWGFVDVKSIRLEGADLRPRALVGRCGEDEPQTADCPRDETVMDVPLPTPVAPGATIGLDLEFEVQLPEVVERTGYGRSFNLVGQWFPKLGVYEPAPGGGARWNCHAFHANSEFYADFGEYVVELTVPADHVVGATGVLVEERPARPGMKTLVYHAEDVHDFVWTADPTFRVVRDRFEDVELTLLYHPGSEPGIDREFAAVKAALALNERLAFPYPYRTVTIVEPPLRAINAGGMEYPTFITSVPGFIAPRGVHDFEETTAHEFGHQYWYGMVASNEFEEAWLDEGVNTYVTGLVMEEMFGEAASRLDLGGLVVSTLEQSRRAYAHRPDLDPLETFAWRFAPGSYWISYSKPALALQTLEGYLGRERARAALGAYARAYRFKHPHAEDFFRAYSTAAGEDLGWFFRPAFRGTEVLDYEILRIESQRREPPLGLFDRDGERVKVGPRDVRRGGAPVYDTSVIVHRRGEFRFPVVVEVAFADGARERVRWDGRDRWHRLTFARGARATYATVDPDRTVLLDVNWLNDGLRRTPERAPARRMRLGLMFLLQSVLQMVGF